MSTRMIALVAMFVVLWAANLPAQNAVQLPTVSAFTVNTTVSVPDRGSALLGGIGRAASGRNEFGMPLAPIRPFRNSAIGHEVGASSMRVTATIHDFEAMDEYLLSGGGGSGGAVPPLGAAAMGKMVLPRNGQIGQSWQVALPPSAEPNAFADRRNDAPLAAERSKADEAADFFARGQQAEAEGKFNVAKICYQYVARRGNGPLKEQAVARLDAINAARGPQVAQSGAK